MKKLILILFLILLFPTMCIMERESIKGQNISIEKIRLYDTVNYSKDDTILIDSNLSRKELIEKRKIDNKKLQNNMDTHLINLHKQQLLLDSLLKKKK